MKTKNIKYYEVIIKFLVRADEKNKKELISEIKQGKITDIFYEDYQFEVK